MGEILIANEVVMGKVSVANGLMVGRVSIANGLVTEEVSIEVADVQNLKEASEGLSCPHHHEALVVM